MIDAHLHVVEAPPRPSEQGAYVPPRFTVADYRARTAGLGITGGVVVAGSFQAGDHAGLLDAIAALGPGFRGVAQLPADADDATIRRLDAAGVRGVRCNVVRGGREALDGFDALARRAWELAGWHAELYVAASDLPELESRIRALPKASVDHLGLCADGQDALLRLVDAGVRVKATGFGRVTLDVPATLAAIHRIDPTALMAGTDLPSTRARRPFEPGDLDLIAETLGEAGARAVLHDNAARFYGLDRLP